MRARRRTVVLVGVEPAIAASLVASRDAVRFAIVTVNDWIGAVDELARGGADVIVADLDDGVAGAARLLESLHRSRSSVGVVGIVAEPNTRGAALAEALGVRWILAKPVEVESLLTAIASAAALGPGASVGSARTAY